MNTHRPLDAQQRERISALMDGQPEGEAAWDSIGGVEDAQLYECWHLYHLVGDVLRTPELAAYTGDAAFLARLRARMDEEALPLLNAALPLEETPAAAREPTNDSVFRWKMLAAAASLAAVALVAWNVAAPQATPGTQIARATPPQANTPVLAAISPASSQGATLALEDSAHGVMLRDPYLDELLAAHRQAAGASGLAAAGFLHNATFAGDGR